MNKRKTGQEQEVKAACFLKTQGYQILERNYRCKKGEIDLIAREGQYLVFVEVKYRSTNESGLPEEAVDLRKQRQISRVAAWYLTEKNPERIIRNQQISLHGRRPEKRRK